MSTLTTASTEQARCAHRVTKSLLGYGVIAGPTFIGVSLAQALTRDGFDLGRHEWSLLANGPGGWVQVANFVITGLMTIAFGQGVRRAVPTIRAGALLTVYGAGLVGAGLFKADPMTGFPVGTPEGPPETVTWHGWLHLVSAGIGFTCLMIACISLARWYSRRGDVVRARLARTTAGVFVVGFGAVASGGHAPAVTLAFVSAVVLAWAWVSATAGSLYRYTDES